MATSYYDHIGQDSRTFKQHASVAEIKTFFERMVDRHVKIKAALSLKHC